MATDITVSATPPPSPGVGDAWWDLTSGQLYIWVADGTSNQWVVAINQPGPMGVAGTPGPPGPVGPPGPAYAPLPPNTTVSTRTLGGLIGEARGLLNDTVPISGAPRFTDAELIGIVNEALLQIRAKRPDAWLSYGLRAPMPLYSMPEAKDVRLPIEDQFYSPLLFYTVGRAELVEDTFADNGRAITLMSKFTSLLSQAHG